MKLKIYLFFIDLSSLCYFPKLQTHKKVRGSISGYENVHVTRHMKFSSFFSKKNMCYFVHT